MKEDLDKDVHEIVQSLVEVVNTNRDEFKTFLDIYKDRTLGFVILDSRYDTAFLVRSGRMVMTKRQEIGKPDATISTFKKIFVDFINAEDMRSVAMHYYNTYGAFVEARNDDEIPSHIHFKNLIDMIKKFQEVVGGG